MSVAKRPFADSRNTYVVLNDDPGAFDKTYKGQPGTHTEQRCCGDRAPYWEYTTLAHSQVSLKPGQESVVGAQGVQVRELYCHECSTALESAWGQFVDSLEWTLGEMSPGIRALAMAISYVPVFGTAVSFVINASLTLAQGGDFESAALDGIGGALPGQPVSGMAFRGVRSLANGDRIDEIGLQAFIQDATARDTIRTAIHIVETIANGEDLTEVVLVEVYSRLPAQGQQAMTLAKRVIDGENVGSIAMKAAADYAKTRGAAAVREYIAQAGYQGAVDSLDPMLRQAFTAGVLVGEAERLKNTPEGIFDTSEHNVPTNDLYAIKGLATINSGATWRNPEGVSVPLVRIRSGSTWTGTIDWFDGLTGLTTKRTGTYTITDQWRRGFDIAIGLCQGKSQDDATQQGVKATLSQNTKDGFNVGQSMQFDRTKALATILLSSFKEAVPVSAQVSIQGLAVPGPAQIASQSVQNQKWAELGIAASLTNSRVAAMRNGMQSVIQKYGFDVGTGVSIGSYATGPGSDNARKILPPEAQIGFDVGRFQQFGISKANLAATGNPLMAASAPLIVTSAAPKTVIAAKEGFFARLLRALGF